MSQTLLRYKSQGFQYEHISHQIFTGCQQLSHMCPFLFLLILGETCQTKVKLRWNLTENPVKSPRLPSSNKILCFLGQFPCLFCSCQKPKVFCFQQRCNSSSIMLPWKCAYPWKVMEIA